MEEEHLYQVAMTLLPFVGAVHAKALVERYGSAAAVFKAPFRELNALEGIGPVRARSIKSFNDFSVAESELRFMEEFRIRPLFLNHRDYPRRLLHCYDSPTLLYYHGNADLNAAKVVAIIGTRSHSEYGRKVTEKLIAGLAGQGVLIVSGLAFGIDSLAHRMALRSELHTVGVLGHGLDMIYPGRNTQLARDMVRSGGGLLSEFRSQTGPDKHHFPIRNRIVAGMCDATVVVETDTRGGSMITAELANGYNRDVFAVPGRLDEKKSAGTNYLIRSNKAILLTDAEQLIDTMGWGEKTIRPTGGLVQRSLFMELGADEKVIVELLQSRETVHIDEISNAVDISSSRIAAAILKLELQNIVRMLPGKKYRLN